MHHSLWTFSVFKVGKDDLEMSKTSSACYKPQLHQPLVNQYSLTLGQDLGQHDTKSLIKCVETLSFIVRDAAHVTPDNFELCVRAIRVFVEASLNGGKTLFFISPPGFWHECKSKNPLNRGCEWQVRPLEQVTDTLPACP